MARDVVWDERCSCADCVSGLRVVSGCCFASRRSGGHLRALTRLGNRSDHWESLDDGRRPSRGASIEMQRSRSTTAFRVIAPSDASRWRRALREDLLDVSRVVEHA